MVVIEDGISHGGIASSLSEFFRTLEIDTPIHSIGVPLDFYEHAKRAQLLEEMGITAQAVARQLVTWFSKRVTQEATQLHVDENVDRKPLH